MISNDEKICHCMDVTHKDMKDAYKKGATTWEALQTATCVSTGCGGCESKAKSHFEAIIKEQ